MMNNTFFISNTVLRLNVSVYYPDNYDELPLIVYLHGAGERGKRMEHIARHGIPRLISEGFDENIKGKIIIGGINI